MTRSYWSCVALLVALSAGRAFAQPEGWTDDIDKAFERSKELHRNVLVHVAGSDWCGWCAKLDLEVFTQDAFKAYAKERWVLVYVDFPHGKKARDASRNQRLKDHYKVEGFPTILLLDPTGEEIARTAYREGGAEQYIAHLEGFLKYPRLRAALEAALAAATTGPAKAAVYLELCRAAKAVGRIQEVADHVALADPTNEHGLHTTLATAQARARLVDGDAQGALERLAELERGFKGAPGTGIEAQAFHLVRGEAFGSLAKPVEEIASVKLAYAAAPDSELAPRIAELLLEKGHTVGK